MSERFYLSEAKTLYRENPDILIKKSCPSLESLVYFIKKSNIPKAVIGLSGGIDSALVMSLAVLALRKNNVCGLIMPAASNVAEDEQYAKQHAESTGIDYKVINIQNISDAALKVSDLFNDPLDFGNLKARLRMSHLYAKARKWGAAVFATGNLSELMVGYFTKFGDGAGDIFPISQLYKTQVWELARQAKVPAEIISRAPSAGLEANQTDEKDLGHTYYDLDRVLIGQELGFNVQEISNITGYPIGGVNDIFSKITNSAHKRTSGLSPEPKFLTANPQTADSIRGDHIRA